MQIAEEVIKEENASVIVLFGLLEVFLGAPLPHNTRSTALKQSHIKVRRLLRAWSSRRDKEGTDISSRAFLAYWERLF